MFRNFKPKGEGRGFTLIEMMFAMGILGLVLSLTLAEFITAFGHFSFAQTHMDAEMAGRVAMSKVNDVLQLASSDHNPADTVPCAAKCPIVANASSIPSGGGPTTDVAIFTTTTDPTDISGQLSPTMNTVGQVPEPDYQVVELSYNALKQEIDEAKFTYSAFKASGAPTSTAVLARNIQDFQVTALNWQANGFCSGFQVNIKSEGPAQGGRPASVAYTSNTVYFSTYAGFQ